MAQQCRKLKEPPKLPSFKTKQTPSLEEFSAWCVFFPAVYVFHDRAIKICNTTHIHRRLHKGPGIIGKPVMISLGLGAQM